MNTIHIIGCGYIGKKLARLLKAAACDVQAYVKSEASASDCERLGLSTNRFELEQPDLALSASQRQAFEQGHIVYLAPPQPRGREDLRMRNFIHMLQSLPVPPKKILLISTTGVYGDCHGEWIDEKRALNPQADRAYRRLSAEQQLQNYCQQFQLDLIIFRVPGIYAQDKLPLKRIRSGEAIVRAADSGYTNRIHAADLAAFCAEALTRAVNPGVYNCCDGHPSTMHDYFCRVADAKAMPRPPEISLQQAQTELSEGMLSYLAESKRISNQKLLANFHTRFRYPDLQAGLGEVRPDD